MPPPEIGRPLPRAAEAFVADDKWHGYVLGDEGHGREWRQVFGLFEADQLWFILAHAVLSHPVTEVRGPDDVGLTCRVPIEVRLNDRTALVRTVWHYDHDDAPPRLVTAFPTP